MKTYCYHCGKELLDEDKHSHGNIHGKCFYERTGMTRLGKINRMKVLRDDPELRERVRILEEEILKKHLEKGK